MALTKKMRQEVMRGTGWKCYRCKTGINSLTGEIHHRDGDRQNNTFSNLRPVCKSCHKELSKAQTKRREKKPWIQR